MHGRISQVGPGSCHPDAGHDKWPSTWNSQQGTTVNWVIWGDVEIVCHSSHVNTKQIFKTIMKSNSLFTVHSTLSRIQIFGHSYFIP